MLEPRESPSCVIGGVAFLARRLSVSESMDNPAFGVGGETTYDIGIMTECRPPIRPLYSQTLMVWSPDQTLVFENVSIREMYSVQTDPEPLFETELVADTMTSL